MCVVIFASPFFGGYCGIRSSVTPQANSGIHLHNAAPTDRTYTSWLTEVSNPLEKKIVLYNLQALSLVLLQQAQQLIRMVRCRSLMRHAINTFNQPNCWSWNSVAQVATERPLVYSNCGGNLYQTVVRRHPRDFDNYRYASTYWHGVWPLRTPVRDVLDAALLCRLYRDAIGLLKLETLKMAKLSILPCWDSCQRQIRSCCDTKQNPHHCKIRKSVYRFHNKHELFERVAWKAKNVTDQYLSTSHNLDDAKVRSSVKQYVFDCYSPVSFHVLLTLDFILVLLHMRLRLRLAVSPTTTRHWSTMVAQVNTAYVSTETCLQQYYHDKNQTIELVIVILVLIHMTLRLWWAMSPTTTEHWLALMTPVNAAYAWNTSIYMNWKYY